MSHTFPLLLDAALKATVLLLVAFAIARIMHRISAAGRHLLWTMTIFGLLAIPVFSWLLPAWTFPLALKDPACLFVASATAESWNPKTI